MNENIVSSNKRIAKNTLFLYFRMFIILGVTLYTSRIILSTLGVSDYGIYNVVGGVVSMFTFISMAMGNATARFITYALGEGNIVKQKRVFNTSILVHTAIAILIFVLAETIGLWFLNHKMIIPVERICAAHWVYQLSIIAAMISIIYSPFNAVIIAHEKMRAFAYISILDVTLKLLIVYLLFVSPFDKLIFYGILYLCVNIIDTVIYYVYCKRNFPETEFFLTKDAQLIKEIGGFAGWSMIGNLASVSYSQGVNILLNIFFGPIVNAASGISMQAQNAAKTFVRNFQTAVNPQITKSYAQKDYYRVHSLLLSSTRLSFYLVFCIVLPLIIEAENVLSLWLVEVPEHTVNFLRLALLVSIIDAFEGPVNAAMNATGKIKVYQLTSCIILLMVIPISYYCLNEGCEPESVFIVQFFIIALAFMTELLLLVPKIGLHIGVYVREIFPRLFSVALPSVFIVIGEKKLLPESKWTFFPIVIVSLLSVCLFVYLWGLNKSEKTMVNTKLKAIFKRHQ